MAVYTKIPMHDLEKIALAYGIKATDFISIEAGNANSNYHIKGKNGNFMLTLGEEKPFQEMQKLAKILSWLEEHGFKTSKVHPSLNGDLMTRYQEKPILIKNWIEGSVEEHLDSNMLKQAGAAMARLHQIPVPDFLPKKHPYGLQIFPEVQDKGIDQLYESWLKEQTAFITKNLPKNLPSGLIHGDLFFDNILFEGDKIKAIIDLEEACSYYLIFDLGMAVIGLCRTDDKIDLTKVKALIEGYETVRLLSSVEKKSLPLFVKYAATATSWWRFWKYNIHSPKPDLSTKHWEMVQVVKEVDVLVTEGFTAKLFH